MQRAKGHMTDTAPTDHIGQPPYANQLQLPAPGQTYEPLIEMASEEEMDEYDHAAALASLANTGMGVLAFEHELSRDMRAMKYMISDMQAGDMSVEEAAERMQKLHDRMAKSRRFLSGPLSPTMSHGGEGTRADGVEARRWEPGRLLAAADDDLGFLVGKRGVTVSWDIEEHLTLPPASYAEWLAMFQNAFVNAVGAVAKRRWEGLGPDDEETPGLIHVEITSNPGAPPTILIHDNGIGVDLGKAKNYFRPFRRGDSRYDSGSRYGGYGLGLSIIQLVASRHGMRAQFIEPSEGWATTLSIAPDIDRPVPKSLSGQVNYEDERFIKLLKWGADYDITSVLRAAVSFAQGRNEEEANLWVGDLIHAARDLRGPTAEDERRRVDHILEHRRGREAQKASEGEVVSE